MRLARRTSALALLALALAGCGSGDDDSGESGNATQGTAPAESPAEGGASAPGGVSAPAPSGDAARAEKVSIVEFTYDPDPVVIEEGGKVTWINRDSAPHTATADDGSFDTGTIAPGKLKSESFKQPGTYAYFCEVHPDMHGTIEVVGSG